MFLKLVSKPILLEYPLIFLKKKKTFIVDLYIVLLIPSHTHLSKCKKIKIKINKKRLVDF